MLSAELHSSRPKKHPRPPLVFVLALARRDRTRPRRKNIATRSTSRLSQNLTARLLEEAEEESCSTRRAAAKEAEKRAEARRVEEYLLANKAKIKEEALQKLSEYIEEYRVEPGEIWDFQFTVNGLVFILAEDEEDRALCEEEGFTMRFECVVKNEGHIFPSVPSRQELAELLEAERLQRNHY